jgi:transcriptional regulator with XRE-family HTH domain
MAREEIGFNEMVRRLGISPSLFSKIQRGEGNITLATLAHIA